MKVVLRVALSGLLALSVSAQAQESLDSSDPSGSVATPGGDSPNSSLRKLVTYLQNLGSYMGYDLTQTPDTLPTTLISLQNILLPEQYLFNSVLGAIPVNPLLGTDTQSDILVSGNATNSDTINKFANMVYTKPSTYNTPQGSIAINPLVDQPTYQGDPVNQAILNILSTPNDSYCMKPDGVTLDPDCKLLYQGKLLTQVMGEVPGVAQYFTFDYNQTALPQLNSNSLTGPLLYTIQSGGGGASSPGGTPSNEGGNQQDTTLSAQDQGQLAANFIRYATGSVIPIEMPKKADYNSIWSDANNPNLSDAVRGQAQSNILNYLASLRVYAAQLSVGYSNLYYILGKRMPQNQGGGVATNTSQALSEFNMASWRIYNPADSKNPNSQWVDKINKASPATVQKEMAILLAEINYQLYLTRQQDERLLLTNSMLLLQNARSTQPSITSVSASGSPETTTTGG
jgi:intracellular multiplication protein IcmX